MTNPIPHLTRASFLAEKGKKTEVVARFSTVAGGAGAGDLPRDVRGFAVKFYTDEGNFERPTLAKPSSEARTLIGAIVGEYDNADQRRRNPLP